mmetsp:Transcript_12536/g.23133  ORF Transcript_12536/g.23133 Transcript_12536/m.23133 type:complete len:274 (+) Transcript_12536:131-952(+)
MNQTASRLRLMAEQEHLEERCWALRLHEQEEKLKLREKAVEFKESLEGTLEERWRLLQEKEEKLRLREMAIKFKEDLEGSLEERWKSLKQKEETLQSMEVQAQAKAHSLQQREEELKSRDVMDKQHKSLQARRKQLGVAESALLVDVVRIAAAMAAFEGRLKREKTRLGVQPTLKFGFHGTDDRGLSGILQHGFKINHPRLGINGSTYGRGIYLAPRPRLALKFAKTSGCTKIILAVYMDVEGVNHHRADDDGGAVVISEEDLVYPKYVLHLN